MDFMLPLLKYAVIGAFAFALVGLILALRKARSFGERKSYALAVGSESAEIRYAFVEGMMPWEKDSARQHVATYVAGVIYHIGIFAAFLLLLLSLAPAQTGQFWSAILVVPVIAGFLTGFGLLIKRISTRYLRAISHPDDFLANLLVDIFLLTAAVTVYEPSLTPLLHISAILLLLYLPLGKIRHCCFFFVSRVTFGKYFGRRGVLPHDQAGA